MIQNLRILLFLPLLLLIDNQFCNADSLTVSSPDKQLRFTVSDDNGRITYRINYAGQPVIDNSTLGITFKDAAPLGDNFVIDRHQQNAFDETWEQPWGEAKFIRDQHQELLVFLRHREHQDQRFALRVRVFNDGLGFRYEVPEQAGGDPLLVTDELTEFSIHDFNDAEAWWIPARGWNRYEYLYRKTGFAAIDRVQTPFTMRLANGLHLSIHEAALLDYPSMTLDQRKDGVLKADLVPWSDGIKVKTHANFTTPWRTLQISPNATGLLNSHLILNLNEPNRLGDVSWVKPGKYIGIWWAMHLGINSWGEGEHHGATTENTKHYIDFARDYGFDGVLVEGWNVGWDGGYMSFTQPAADFDLNEVSRYAKTNGVHIIGHHETHGNASDYRKQMNAAYDLYQGLGVTQIKTGYVADGGNIQRIDEKGLPTKEWHDGQFMVNEYLHSVTEAARRHLSIDTHEPIKDTGLRRTYPNWLSREGARGQEFNAWGNPPNNPEHTVNLVYTRMLAGPMDFTPGIFNLTQLGPKADKRVPTTLAKQLALYVVLYSPIQMAADLPENYLKRLDAFQFIRDVATDWQQSIALAGEIGDYVVFARQVRDSSDWFIGAITDENTRQIDIKLDFLEAGRQYRAQIYRDGEKADWQTNPYDLVIEERTVTNQQRISVKLAAGGGVAVRLKLIE